MLSMSPVSVTPASYGIMLREKSTLDETLLSSKFRPPLPFPGYTWYSGIDESAETRQFNPGKYRNGMLQLRNGLREGLYKGGHPPRIIRIFLHHQQQPLQKQTLWTLFQLHPQQVNHSIQAKIIADPFCFFPLDQVIKPTRQLSQHIPNHHTFVSFRLFSGLYLLTFCVDNGTYLQARRPRLGYHSSGHHGSS